MALKPDTSSGVSTGFLVWLVLAFCFVLLRYDPIVSLGLAAIAGISSGYIASWWNAKEDFYSEAPRQPTPGEITVEARPMPPLPEPRPGFGVQLRRRHQRPAQRRFGWLFRRSR